MFGEGYLILTSAVAQVPPRPRSPPRTLFHGISSAENPNPRATSMSLLDLSVAVLHNSTEIEDMKHGKPPRCQAVISDELLLSECLLCFESSCQRIIIFVNAGAAGSFVTVTVVQALSGRVGGRTANACGGNYHPYPGGARDSATQSCCASAVSEGNI